MVERVVTTVIILKTITIMATRNNNDINNYDNNSGSRTLEIIIN